MVLRSLCLQKAKLEAKLHQTTSAAAAAASGVGPIHNSVPSNTSSAPGFFIHPSDVIPPTPKTTPLFMTPPLTPPNEAVSAAFSAELAHLFPGSMMDPGPVNLTAHKNAQKSKPVSKVELRGGFLSPPHNKRTRVLSASESHGQRSGSGHLTGVPLPAAAAAPVHHHREDAFRYRPVSLYQITQKSTVSVE